jgi:polyphosphate kinase 2 (PPK2 family)
VNEVVIDVARISRIADRSATLLKLRRNLPADLTNAALGSIMLSNVPIPQLQMRGNSVIVVLEDAAGKGGAIFDRFLPREVKPATFTDRPS